MQSLNAIFNPLGLKRVLRLSALLAVLLPAVLLPAVLLPAVAAEAEPQATGTPFSFVALGDLPYGDPKLTFPPYSALIDAINQRDPDFSIHIGDFKSGSTLCSDQEFGQQLAHFNRFAKGLVYTPGDNEWTDCHRSNNGGYDPLERLDTLRRMFFRPGRSLGQQSLAVANQPSTHPQLAAYIENQRWVHQQVLFVTLHIVGSNNNFEARDPRMVTEYFARDAANLAWIQSAFDLARSNAIRAVVFAFQADPFEGKSLWEDFPPASGFRNSIGLALLPQARALGKPVLVVHGDSHQTKIDQPFKLERKTIANVTRLIVPGDQDMRAVLVRVQPAAAQVFGFEFISP
jgi:hypothetical protein